MTMVATDVKVSAWVDVTVDHSSHEVEFMSHGDIVLRFTNAYMFGREFLHLNVNETTRLPILQDGDCMYYIFQLAPALSGEQYSMLVP